MSCEIFITKAAERDIAEAADYIEFILYNPTAADDLLDEADIRINELAFMPEKHAVVDDPILKTWGIRFTMVNNYMAFYTIDDRNSIVYIVRFLFSRRDWISILKKGISLE